MTRFRVDAALLPRLAMGALAFALLIAAEAALYVSTGNRTVEAFARSLAEPAGALGLAGQAAFGLFPVVRLRLRMH